MRSATQHQPPLATQQSRRSHLRNWALTGGAVALLGLTGCAAMNTLTLDVSSFGEWPADRKPGTYAFERLPSQQARAKETAQLEDTARPALAKAGFVPVAEGQLPDVLVQVGSRIGRADYSPWDDPLWFGGAFGSYRRGPWIGPRWGISWRHDFSRYEHQVALLLRDRASGKPLYETRAVHESSTELTSLKTLELMFQASLTDFPRLGLNPRTISLPLS